jgi:hypothetical protein
MQTAGIAAAFVPGAVVRLGMAVIFALSCVHMLRDFGAHRGIVASYRLLPASTVPGVATLLALANFSVAALLVPPATAAAASGAGVALLLLYAAAMQINISRGRTHIDCGCGGAQGQTIAKSLVARNVFLAMLLAAAAQCPPSGTRGAIPMITVLGGAASFAALYFAANQLRANRAAFAQAGT